MCRRADAGDQRREIAIPAADGEVDGGVRQRRAKVADRVDHHQQIADPLEPQQEDPRRSDRRRTPSQAQRRRDEISGADEQALAPNRNLQPGHSPHLDARDHDAEIARVRSSKDGHRVPGRHVNRDTDGIASRGQRFHQLAWKIVTDHVWSSVGRHASPMWRSPTGSTSNCSVKPSMMTSTVDPCG